MTSYSCLIFPPSDSLSTGFAAHFPLPEWADYLQVGPVVMRLTAACASSSDPAQSLGPASKSIRTTVRINIPYLSSRSFPRVGTPGERAYHCTGRTPASLP
jgi:hypothetical protein